MVKVTKKTTEASSAAKKTPAHPPYAELIKNGILHLKERNGSSRQALKKYIQTNFNITAPNFDSLFNAALRRGVEKEIFIQPKGASGPVKLNKKVNEPKKETKPVAKKAAPKKAAVKAASTPATTPAAKKATPKKVTKPAPKKKATAVKKAAPAKKPTPTKKVAKKETAKKATKAKK